MVKVPVSRPASAATSSVARIVTAGALVVGHGDGGLSEAGVVRRVGEHGEDGALRTLEEGVVDGDDGDRRC
jgi:hypothetical protein